MSSVKDWVGKLFWGVAGNALYSAIASGGLVALLTTAIAKLLSLNPVWIDRGITALLACIAIAIFAKVFSYLRSYFGGAETKSAPPVKVAGVPHEYEEIVNQSFENRDIPL